MLGYKIYFCDKKPDVASVEPKSIIFKPMDSGWNDFGFKCKYSYYIVEGDKSADVAGSLFLGFVGEHENIVSMQVKTDGALCSADDFPPFFTLQGEMSDYRSFVAKHDVEDADKLLSAMNDMVVARQEVDRDDWYAAALKSEVFSLAFMRDSGRFFAFHNADSVLGGLKGEDFSRISSQFRLEYNLSGFSSAHCFDLNFDLKSILPKRINVLIGRNGLGKSQALNFMVQSLLGDGEYFVDRHNGRPMISRVLAIATPGETLNTFPAERSNRGIEYKRLVLDRNYKSETSRSFSQLCVQLARNEGDIGEQTRWKLFVNSLACLSGYENIVLPVDGIITAQNSNIFTVDDQKYIQLKELARGGEQAKLELWGGISRQASPSKYLDGIICPLSSGQLAFIKFAVQACLFIENGSLVLLDEPETHLHPNYISEFVRLLDRLLEATGSVAVIATHSAYFVREVPRSQVLVFKQSEVGGVDVQNPRLKTFGADIGSISYFVFEDEISNILVEELVEKLPSDTEERFAVLEELKEELSSEVLMYLRRSLAEGEQSEKD